MAIPEPRLGLVISYAYLWHHEKISGREEAIKDRPCVVILAVRSAADGVMHVGVAPITHRMPDDPAVALEIPPAVKRHLRLDTERSWIILNEINEFAWPGFDLRPVSGQRTGFAFGFLPPALFEKAVRQLRTLWQEARASRVRRD